MADIGVDELELELELTEYLWPGLAGTRNMLVIDKSSLLAPQFKQIAPPHGSVHGNITLCALRFTAFAPCTRRLFFSAANNHH
jgi:hypothetical protein